MASFSVKSMHIPIKEHFHNGYNNKWQTGIEIKCPSTADDGQMFALTLQN